MKAPERIWVEKQIAEPGIHGSTAWPNTDCESDIEYVRADLPSTFPACLAHPEVKALVEALSKISRRPGDMIWGEDYEVREAMTDMEAIANAALARIKDAKP